VPIQEAHVSLDDINFTYGYGVYETLKVRKQRLFFAQEHMERLLHSAQIIGLQHQYSHADLCNHLEALLKANGRPDSNLKVLLVGRTDVEADVYVLELNPLFPKRHDYRDGTKVILWEGERAYPQAKTLNMLISTIAYRAAQAQASYDALLVDRDGYVREGTRTNLFYLLDNILYTPPATTVLAGVTRHTVIRCLTEHGQAVVERALHRSEIARCAMFLTSTSTKIMPIAAIGEQKLTIDPSFNTWMGWYDEWLAAWST
jgi:branched-subunit amino acid aminotransferase/4-amino-4-deoxychorismate lyase